jgi:hypothetical protein
MESYQNRIMMHNWKLSFKDIPEYDWRVYKINYRHNGKFQKAEFKISLQKLFDELYVNVELNDFIDYIESKIGEGKT